MGYGGALIWTGFAYNLAQTYPNKKIIFIYKTGLRHFLSKSDDFKIYKNNPHIHLIISSWIWKCVQYFFNSDKVIIINMNDPGFSYALSSSNEKVIYKNGKHAIGHLCEYYGIKNYSLQPVIKLSKKEKIKADQLLLDKEVQNKFICFEPHSKHSFTENKGWFWDRWERLLEQLHIDNQKKHNKLQFLQIGAKTNQVLPHVINLTGQLSFRETSRILEKSKLLISYIGGLVHLARAVNIKSVVLSSAWEPKELALYPENITLYHDVSCKNCGLRTPCPYHRKCMDLITVEDVIKAINQVIK